jgi:catechol 2,3-dioxygenase-like lactoylglutathione lyase family enzyme
MFTQLRPVLYVDDLSAETEFYQKLGFQILFQTPDSVGLVFGQPILFGLQHRTGATYGADQPVFWQIATDNIDEVYQRCQQENLLIQSKPELQSWGEYTMTVVSPNGYRVVFEGPKNENHE